MTTKQKFEVENPNVVVLSNGRYAYRVKCPWEGKNGKELYAWKFCSLDAYNRYNKASEPAEQEEAPEEAGSKVRKERMWEGRTGQ